MKGGGSLRVLHFAPERILGERLSLCPNIEYIAADLKPSSYTVGGVIVEKVDVTQIPFPASSFDVVLCNHVLEHVPDDILALREIFRVLQPGGWAVLQIPMDPKRERTYEDFSITSEEDRQRAFGQKDHVRWYGRDYRERLRGVGFEVEEVFPEDRLSKDEIQQFAIRNAGCIPLARKPTVKDMNTPALLDP
jgi:SAM-dependent methyltransferase